MFISLNYAGSQIALNVNHIVKIVALEGENCFIHLQNGDTLSVEMYLYDLLSLIDRVTTQPL
ncbi:hypothetical protein [Flavobacterium covae]|uniref:hypothetical protein n=1 Tax=Flavobacterium covae TaxID=2906076 RepID=UPI0035E40B61